MEWWELPRIGAQRRLFRLEPGKRLFRTTPQSSGTTVTTMGTLEPPTGHAGEDYGSGSPLSACVPARPCLPALGEDAFSVAKEMLVVECGVTALGH